MLSKSAVIIELNKQLSTKLHYLKESLQSTIESRNTDTKSSAGDKFETSREMAQIEIHKIEIEIFKTQQFISDLLSKVTQFISTDKGLFLFAIPFGKLMLNNSEVFCISNAAPITKDLLDTKISGNFIFRGVAYKVISIS